LSLRLLWRAPGYSTAVILTLALIVGANSAIFSAVHAVLLNSLPIRQPDRVIVAWEADAARNLPVVELSHRNFQDWATHSRSFVQTAAVGSSTWSVVLELPGAPVRLSSAGVAASFFDTLGVVPALGRALTPEDDRPSADPVVVLSHGAWVRLFASDASVIGRTIQLNGSSTVVGVMPEDFDYPRGTDVWLPVSPILAAASRQDVDAFRDVGVLFVVGRLRDGVTRAMAAKELNELSIQLQREGAGRRFGTSVVVMPFLEHVLGPVRQALWALFAAVGILLLVGCANVSGLMLTRLSLRHHEHAVRLALGASGGRLGRLWLLEAGILALAGGILGLVASDWLAQAIVVLGPGDVPRLETMTINVPVALFTFLVAAIAALLCAAEPVRQARTSRLLEPLRGAGVSTSGQRPRRARSILTTIQIGLAVVLLVSAGLVLRSFLNLRQLDLGFEPTNVLTLNVEPRGATNGNAWIAELLNRLQATSGIEESGAVLLRPLALGPIGSDALVVLEGQPRLPGSATRNPSVNYQVATAGYFSAMRIHLKEGRLFDERDTARSPRVVLVSERTARTLWPGERPLGKRLLLPSQLSDGPDVWRTVVGVVSDARYRGLDDVRLDVYDAASQSRTAATQVVLRTSRDPLTLASLVQSEARRLDPRAVVDGVTTMDAIVSQRVAPWRFSLWMFALFALLAFVLATLGLFSVVSLDISHRRHEFALRVAFGAQSTDVVRTVMTSAVRQIVAGLSVGVLLAALGTRALQGLLFDVGRFDLATYATVSALVLAVVVSAAYLPARRAGGANPLALLRRE
jgi:predicted permease